MTEENTDSTGQLIFDLEFFDGPLDLLLHLIKKDEIDICDIPIAEITRQYLSYLDACRELNLELAGEFLQMAAMLIRIKAQMLLPSASQGEEWEDPRSELVNALVEYSKVKKASTCLGELAERQGRRYPRRDFTLFDIPPAERELVKVDLTTLMIAFGDLLQRAREETTYEVAPVEVTVEMRKDHILSVMQRENGVAFEELFAGDRRRIVMVVTFVALLELVRQGILRVEQASRFSTIRLYRVNEGVMAARGNG